MHQAVVLSDLPDEPVVAWLEGLGLEVAAPTDAPGCRLFLARAASRAAVPPRSGETLRIVLGGPDARFDASLPESAREEALAVLLHAHAYNPVSAREAEDIPSVIRGLTGGDSEIAREIIGEFITSNREDFLRLSAAAARDDLAGAAAAAHSIKGAARMIQAWSLVALTTRLEAAGTEGNGALANAMIPLLGTAIGYLEERLGAPTV